MTDLMPFGRQRCPKCRTEDVGKLFYTYHTQCPDNDKVCGGEQDEHLHFECRSCNYTGPMRTGDTDTGTTQPAVTTVTTPVALRKRKPHKHTKDLP